MNETFWDGFEKEAGRASGAKKILKAGKGAAEPGFGTKLEEAFSMGKTKAKEGYEGAKTWAKANPLKATGAAAGATGLAGGYAMGKNKNQSPYG